MNQTLPVLFVGHGSPMNALAENDYVRDLRRAAALLPRPRAVLVVSAHWQSRGTRITASPKPAQVYDFYGFPPELYALRWTPAGDPELAARAAGLLSAAGFPCALDEGRGLDHAAWAPLRRMYPEASIPVLELSLDLGMDARARRSAGEALAPLRGEGVLILASGNLVHNLGEIDPEPEGPSMGFARAFDAFVAAALEARDDESLLAWDERGPDPRRAHPSPEHFIPLHYALGAARGEPASTLHASIQHGSVSMRSVAFGLGD